MGINQIEFIYMYIKRAYIEGKNSIMKLLIFNMQQDYPRVIEDPFPVLTIKQFKEEYGIPTKSNLFMRDEFLDNEMCIAELYILGKNEITLYEIEAE